jgi:hypothetical protein
MERRSGKCQVVPELVTIVLYSVEGSIFVDYTFLRPDSESPDFYRRLEIQLALSVEAGVVAEGLSLRRLAHGGAFDVSASDTLAAAGSGLADQLGSYNQRTQCLLILCLSNTLPSSAFDVSVAHRKKAPAKSASGRMDGDSTKK